MIAETKDLTRLTIELTAEELDKVANGALIQSTITTDGEKSFLLEIYCAFPPFSNLSGQILQDWD